MISIFLGKPNTWRAGVALAALACGGARLEAATGFFQRPAANLDPYGGPTELQDTFLPTQLRSQTYPQSARVLPVGMFNGSATVDWTAHLAQTDTFLFDGESVTTTLRVRHSPLRAWEFGFDLPHTIRTDGVADRFIEWVETTLNAKVPARFTLPRDTYQAVLETPEGRLITLRKDQGLSDMTLQAKRQIAWNADHKVDAALSFGLSLPTGAESFGGDGVGPSLGLHVQKPFQHFNLFAGASGIYYTDADYDGWEMHEMRGMFYGGTMWKPFSWVSLILAYQAYSPIAPENEPLNSFSHYYSVAFRFYMGKRATLELGVVENLGVIENRNSSDVTLKAALGMSF